MSILIKSLNKPHACVACWFWEHCDRWRNRNWGGSPPDDCPIEAAPATDVTDKNIGEWIPVTERLPEETRDGCSDDVLMFVENPDGDITWKDVYVGYYLYDTTSAETGWWAMMTCDCVKIGEHKHGDKVFPANEYVTHWMPLPEPPEEG